MSAVCPRKVSIAFTSAPRSISSSAISSEPMLAASMSAVWLSPFGESGSAPASSSMRTSAGSPSFTASVSGVEP